MKAARRLQKHSVRLAHFLAMVVALVLGLIPASGWAADSTSSARSLLRQGYGGQTGSQEADDLRSQTMTEEEYAGMVRLAAEAGTEIDFNRAYFTFQPELIDGDLLHSYWPWLRVFKLGGEWESSIRSWYVPKGEHGKLCLILNRAVLNAGALELKIEFYDGSPDAEGASLYVDLVDENEGVLISSELYGNLLSGSGEILEKSLLVPVGEYPEARGIYLSGEGEVFVLGVSLARQGGGLATGEREDSATIPEQSGAGGVSEQAPSTRSGQAPPASEGTSAAGPSGTAKRHLAAGAAPLQSKLVKAKTLAQFVMSDEHFIMTRAALTGGGGRLTSENFILEDTFGQSSTIGFSYGSGVTLHWGFQQSEVELIAAQVRLEPEALKVNPGILTAFVSLPEGYPISGITSATCDGASPERMMLNDDGTEMIIKFRRQAIEAALAEQGETIDAHFVVEGIWQGPAGGIPFVGEDDISRIIH